MSNQVTLSHCPKLGRECIAYGVCWRPRPNPPPPRPSPHLRFVVVVGVVVAVLAAGACPAGARALFPKRAMADDCKQAIPNMDDGKSSDERLSRRSSPSGSQRSGTSLYLPAPAPAPKPKLIIMIHSFQQTRTQNHQHQDRHLLTSTTTFSTVIATRSSGPGKPWAVAIPLPCPCLSCTWLVLSLHLACPPCQLPRMIEATAVNSVICATSLAVTLFSRHLCSEWGLREAQSKRHRLSWSSRFRPAIHFRAASPTGCRLTEFTELIQSSKCSSNRRSIIN